MTAVTATSGVATGLGRRLARLTEHEPHRTAVRYVEAGLWRSVSRAELAGDVEAVGAGLVALGAAPHGRVLVLSSVRYEWLLVELAVQAGVGVSVSAPLFDPPERLAELLQDVKVIVAEDQEQVDRLLASGADLSHVTAIVYLDGRGLRRYPDPRLMSFREMREAPDRAAAGEWRRRRSAAAPQDVASVVLTLGTTRPARAVQLTHAMVGRDLDALQQLVEPRPDDSFVATLPHQHPLERRLSLSAPLLEPSVTVHFGHRSVPPEETLREVQPTVVLATPSEWRRRQVRTDLELDRSTRLKRAAARLTRRTEGGSSPGGARRVSARRSARLLADGRILHALGLSRTRLALSTPGVPPESTSAWFARLGITVTDVYATAGAGLIAWARDAEPATLVAADGVETDVRDGDLWLRHDAWRRGPGDDAGWHATGDVGELAPGPSQFRVVGRRSSGTAASDAAVARLERRLADHEPVAHAVVDLAGDEATAWLAFDPDTVSAWAGRAGVAFVTMRDLAANDSVGELTESIVRTVSREGPAITRFAVVPFALELADGTRTVGDEPRRYALPTALADSAVRLREVRR